MLYSGCNIFLFKLLIFVSPNFSTFFLPETFERAFVKKNYVIPERFVLIFIFFRKLQSSLLFLCRDVWFFPRYPAIETIGMQRLPDRAGTYVQSGYSGHFLRHFYGTDSWIYL